MGRRNRSNTVSVHVDVDISEVLEELSDEALLDEIAGRKLSAKLFDAETSLEAIRTALLRNDAAGALLVVDAVLFPRFKSTGACLLAYREARGLQ